MVANLGPGAAALPTALDEPAGFSPASRDVLVLVVLVVPSVLLSLGSTARAGASVQTSTDGARSWTVYHGDPAGSRVPTSLRSVITSRRAWTSAALDGQVYGEPLVSGPDV